MLRLLGEATFLFFKWRREEGKMGQRRWDKDKHKESKNFGLKWKAEEEDTKLKDKTWPYKIATAGKLEHADF